MLPRPNTQLTIRDLYPDRIKYSFQFACPPVSIALFNTALRSIEDPHVLSLPLRNFRVDIGSPFGEIGCNISRAGVGAPITIHVEANVLRHLHSWRGDYGGESAHARNADNWLHPEDVSPSNQIVRDATSELCDVVRQSAWHLASCIVNDLPGSNGCAPLHSTSVELELAVDLETAHPALVVERMAANLTRMAVEVCDRQYVTRPAVYSRLAKHARMISADLRGEGYSIKVYDKTNQRVRVEVTLNYEGARALGIRLSLHDRTIIEMLDQAAAAVLSDIQSVVTLAPRTIENRVSVLDAVATIYHATSNRRAATAAVEAASLTGRLTHPEFPYRFLNNLIAAGLLEPGRLGVYVVTPLYWDALRFLAPTSAATSALTPGDGS